jgi:hypothetical protein
MIDLESEICKLVLKLDFTAHGIMESLSKAVRHEQVISDGGWSKLSP